ncbi:MAG: hypothetical protein ACHQHK_00665 [Dongiales bacterium]
MSKKFIAPLAAVAVALISLSASAQEFSMKGTWTGHRERIAQTEGYRNETATLVVTEEQGLTFKGTMHWSTSEGDKHDDLVGAFTPGGKLIAGADAEGTYVFNLIDANTLDYCYSEHGEGFRTTCAHLTRQP